MTKASSLSINFLVSLLLLIPQAGLGFSVQPPHSSKFSTTTRTKMMYQTLALQDSHTITTASSSSSSTKDNDTDDVVAGPIDPANIVIAGRYFQLEEMEDAETRMMGLWLHPNNTVTAVVSDTPCFSSAQGTWERTPEGQFSMSLTSTFKAGRKAIFDTDMGEFVFSMHRFYTGELSMVGSSASVNGAVHILDELLGDEKVGYYSMIDTQLDRNEDEDGDDKLFEKPVFSYTNGGYGGYIVSKSSSM